MGTPAEGKIERKEQKIYLEHNNRISQVNVRHQTINQLNFSSFGVLPSVISHCHHLQSLSEDNKKIEKKKGWGEGIDSKLSLSIR